MSASRLQRTLVAVACAALSLGLGFVVLELPPDSPGLREPVRAALAASGVGNPVTAVLLNFRGYDTLLEAAVLLLALCGMWSLSRDADWGAAPGALPARRPGPPQLPAFVRVVAPVAVLVGGYLLWAGADAPGGAFQAGTLLAATAVLLLLAGMARAPATRLVYVRAVVAAGFVVFLLVGVAVQAAGGAFLQYPPGIAKSLILLIEAALTVSIAATLALLVAGLPTAGGDARP